MLCRRPLSRWRTTLPCRSLRCVSTAPVICIRNGTFYKDHPSTSSAKAANPALLSDFTFSLPNGLSTSPSEREYWSVLSPSSVARTTFLQILAGQHICLPPTSRRYPHLSEIGSSAQQAVRYVGFDAERGNSVSGAAVRGAYLSARYESRREETDFTVRDYLLGNTELNPVEREDGKEKIVVMEEVVGLLGLGRLMEMPVANLSNGQTRRARIAKALMEKPEVLLLDGPFMGLDPRTILMLSGVLQGLAEQNRPRLVVSLRPEDAVPEWISHLVVVDEGMRVLGQGEKQKVLGSGTTSSMLGGTSSANIDSSAGKLSRDGFPRTNPPLPIGEALVEMNGIKVSYGDNTVLGDWQQTLNGEPKQGLWWSLHRGQRCGIFGPNGSGKTTMLSLITSDHPQTYSLPIKLFGRSRLPGPGEPGISLFDIQKRMGHSSPEVHAFFPKGLSVRRTLESAWADAPMAKPELSESATGRVDACLRWFAGELRAGGRQTSTHVSRDGSDVAWAKDMRFGELSFSSQRLALFLRAIVATPDLVILDEAFSGMDEVVRDKALLFLSRGERVNEVVQGTSEQTELGGKEACTFTGLSPEQALLVISHAKEDVPGCVREWICLPDPGEGNVPRIGTLQGPLELNTQGWDEIWGRDR